MNSMMEQVMKCNAHLSELDPVIADVMDALFASLRRNSRLVLRNSKARKPVVWAEHPVRH